MVLIRLQASKSLITLIHLLDEVVSNKFKWAANNDWLVKITSDKILSAAFQRGLNVDQKLAMNTLVSALKAF